MEKRRKTLLQKKSAKFITSFVLGVITGCVLGFFLDWKTAFLCGWAVFSLCLILLIYIAFIPINGQHTKKLAIDDRIRYPSLDILILVASLISLVIVILLLTRSKGNPLRICFCLFSIFATWTLIHFLYTVHYTEQYFKNSTGKDKGINFNSKEIPSFIDFLYLSYTVGMTYQVSDTSLTTGKFRQLVLVHSLVSFIFNTMLIATAINFVASLTS